MGGQKFQYDESGGTFFYFLLSFLALLLIPSTYYWWPRKEVEDPQKDEKDCHCEGCSKKKVILKTNEPWKGTKQLFKKLLIISGWLVLGLLAYKVSQFDYEYANFDPYEILGIPLGSSKSEVKKAYKQLSLVLHPDKKTGDEKAFMKLTKAYLALTDDEARKNWEKYGNPDGPGAMSFGIALPSWIVEKENSVWVLGLYALVFMVALPTVVGIWWYRSIRYTGDQVLLDTSQMYYYFFHKTPSMALKRVIMILGASLEFEKQYNSEIVERPTDNVEIPQLMRQIYNLGEKNREKPLCYRYSIKARVLIHAHLSRLPLNPLTLDKDRMYIVKKCPYLIQEMVNCVSGLIMLAYARRIPRLPSIETIENCMKLCPMMVQALWEFKSPLLQLPHVKEEHLKYFINKKRYVKTIQQLVQLKSEDRRNILRFLNDEEYEDVMKVVGKMPLIDFQVRSEVIDDEASTVYTAGAIVTVTVTLIRRDMSTLLGDETVKEKHCALDSPELKEEDEAKSPEGETKEPVKKQPVWQKQRKAGKKSGKKQQGKKHQHNENKAQSNKKAVEEKPPASTEKEKEKQPLVPQKKTQPEGADGDDSSAADESDISDYEQDKSDDDESGGDRKESGFEDDDDWEKFQTGIKKREKILEGKSKISHSVHCPYFPEEKQEYWWVYLSDRKSRTLLTSPYHVTALVDKEEIQLKFTAPRWPGLYSFTVCLRSDSYLGFDQTQELKLDVKEAPEVPLEHPQWDMSGEEEDGRPDGEASDASEFATDEDIDSEHDQE
ncbi:translocation protein SEC63 homolog [Halyomorpha halys]|uniref:translocation protein SEC63 homolog n=1 Tax=Halyomorpha halys TaxID=286706 RepID=UPI0006D4E135|nr:translocation protein SEC63 homolog [Halyomorpha halys]